MDLNTVTSYRFARTRDDLALADGEKILGGGTWLFSEPQPHVTGLVDLSSMGWPDLEVSERGLRIAATCTIARLVAFARGAADSVAATGGADTFSGTDAGGSGIPPLPLDWAASALFPVAANALLASFKIWNTATVGGNVCQSFSTASLVSLSVALDGEAVIWTPDGGERRQSVASLMTGNGTNSLAHGEVLRAIDLPAHALRSRALMRKIALAELGRSGAVVTARVDAGDAAVFTVTAATLTPTVLRFEALPDVAVLASAVGEAHGYYSDPLGAADWRRAVSIELALQLRDELAGER